MMMTANDEAHRRVINQLARLEADRGRDRRRSRRRERRLRVRLQVASRLVRTGMRVGAPLPLDCLSGANPDLTS